MKLPASLKRKVLLTELMQKIVKFDPEAVSEMPFTDIMPTKRKFRADFYLPNLKIIIEVNGGQYLNGRHNRGGKGYETDLYKLNLAQFHGFKIYQFTYEMLERGELDQFLGKKVEPKGTM